MRSKQGFPQVSAHSTAELTLIARLRHALE